MSQETSPPLACDMSAFDDAGRARHAALTRRLFAALERTEPLPEGYCFHFAGAVDGERFTDLAEWCALERTCCPFLVFTLELDGDRATLALTGPEGTPAFLEEEFRLRDR